VKDAAGEVVGKPRDNWRKILKSRKSGNLEIWTQLHPALPDSKIAPGCFGVLSRAIFT